MRYDAEMLAWLRKHRPLVQIAELTADFCERFAVKVDKNALSSACMRFGIRAGGDGRFKPKHAPHNNGVYCRVSEKTEFKRGNRPANAVSVGTIVWKGTSRKKNDQGYLAMKIAEPNVWEYLHHRAWLNAHGKIPSGHAIIFKDSNRENLAIDNLACVDRATLAQLNKLKYSDQPKELRDSVLALARLRARAGKLKKRDSA